MKAKELTAIGNVKIDLSYYSCREEYSDGDVEDVILDSSKNEEVDRLLDSSSDYTIMYHLSDLRENILEWFPFVGTESVLEVGSGCGAITGLLSRKCKNVTGIELSKRRSLINAYRNRECSNIELIVGNFQYIEPNLGKYDIITLVGVLEYAALYIKSDGNPYQELLSLLVKHLKRDGRIIIAIENKMGIKYWNGAWEDHTGKQYSGLNDYTDSDSIRTFSHGELTDLLKNSGIDNMSFYYPVPDYKFPNQIFSDEYTPKAGTLRTFRQDYYLPQLYNFYDATVNDQVCRDKMFSYFANSFLVVTGNPLKTCYIKYSNERRREFRIATIIERIDGIQIVKKYPLSNSATQHIIKMMSNQKKWENTLTNISCSQGRIENNNYISQYIEGNTLEEDFFFLRNDSNKFIDKLKEFVEYYLIPPSDILKPFVITSEYTKVFGENYLNEGRTAPITNIDCIFSNLKKTSQGVYSYDFEWIFDFPIPFEFPIWRAANALYDQYQVYLKARIDRVSFLKEIGIDLNKQMIFDKMEKRFYCYVCGVNNEYYLTNKYVKNAIMQTSRIY